MGDSHWRDWDELNRHLHGGHPLLDSRFLRPLLDYFGTGGEHLLAYHHGDRLAGAAILFRKRLGLWQTFLPGQAPVAPVLFPDAAMALMALRHLPITALAIDYLCQDPLCSPFDHPGAGATIAVSEYAETMAISLQEGFTSYWLGRSPKLRQNISRYLRRAEQAGLGVELARISDLSDLAAAVGRYGELESKGWKGREGTAVHSGNRQGRFYAAVMQGFGTIGDAEVFEMRMGGRLAASRLVIRNSDFRVMLKTTYDEDLGDYAPGRLLLHGMLERVASEQGSRRIEFYTKATTDQLAWATDQRPTVHVRGFRWQWAHSAYRMLKRIRSIGASGEVRQSQSDTASA